MPGITLRWFPHHGHQICCIKGYRPTMLSLKGAIRELAFLILRGGGNKGTDHIYSERSIRERTILILKGAISELTMWTLKGAIRELTMLILRGQSEN